MNNTLNYTPCYGLLAALLVGCVSPATRQRLEGAYAAATPHLAEAPRPALAHLDRAAVVAAALAQSPALALQAHRVRALVHAGAAEGALPAPDLWMEAVNLPLDRPVGTMGMYAIQLRQQLPAPGSRDARARAMAEEAHAALAALADAEQALAQRASDAFTDYMQAWEAHDLWIQQRARLVQLRQAVLARTSTAPDAQAIARIDLALTQVEQAIARLEGERLAAREALSALLLLPPGANLPPPHTAVLEHVPLSLGELEALAATHRGALQEATARTAAAAARQAAARAEARAPEFMVGLGYWQDLQGAPSAGVMASMSLPWLWGPAPHRLLQAQEEAALAQAAREGVAQEIQGEIGLAHARLRAAAQQTRIVLEQGLPAVQRLRAAQLAALPTGDTTLLAWIEAAQAALDTELELVMLHCDLERGIAALERAVGTALPRAPLDGAP